MIVGSVFTTFVTTGGVIATVQPGLTPWMVSVSAPFCGVHVSFSQSGVVFWKRKSTGCTSTVASNPIAPSGGSP